MQKMINNSNSTPKVPPQGPQNHAEHPIFKNPKKGVHNIETTSSIDLKTMNPTSTHPNHPTIIYSEFVRVVKPAYSLDSSVRLDVTTLSYNPQQYTKGSHRCAVCICQRSVKGMELDLQLLEERGRQETKRPRDSNTESHRAEWSQKSYGFKAKDDRHYPTGYIYCWESDCHRDCHIG